MIHTLFGSGEGKKSGFLDRMKQAVARTRENLNRPIEDVFLGKEIDRETLAALEASLIAADLGVPPPATCSSSCARRPTASRSRTSPN